jgi:competence protein ComEC
MRKSYQIFIWKEAPFLRLLVPVISGIILQFHFKMPINAIIVSAIILLSTFILFTFLPEAIRFRFKVIQGILISLFLISFGSLITWQKNVKNQPNWYGIGDSILSKNNLLVNYNIKPKNFFHGKSALTFIK